LLATVFSSLTLLRALLLVTNPTPIVTDQPYTLAFNRQDGDPEQYTLVLLANTMDSNPSQIVLELDFKRKFSITKDSVKDNLALFGFPQCAFFYKTISFHSLSTAGS
jgi:hypothetical protein